jgi:hypothetical protein
MASLFCVHHVAVIAIEESNTTTFNPGTASKSLIPEKYINPQTSGLSIEVTPGKTNEVVLELSSVQ